MIKRHTKMTRDWFGEWSNEYDRTLGTLDFHRALLDLAVKNSGVQDGDKVLDIGCGTGLLALKFLKAADCDIIAVDNSKEMLTIFEDKIKKLRLGKQIVCKFMDADCIKFPSNRFDIVATTLAIHHLKKKLGPIRKIYRVIKPGGVFVIGEIDMDTTGKLTDVNRFKRIIKVLEQEWLAGLETGNLSIFERMFDNSKRHIFNRGDYCISLKQWAQLCKKAGFRKVAIKKVPHHKCFGVVIAEK